MTGSSGVAQIATGQPLGRLVEMRRRLEVIAERVGHSVVVGRRWALVVAECRS